MRATTLVRLLVLPVALLGTGVLALVYVVGLDLAAQYPAQAHLHVPFFLAVLAASLPFANAGLGLWRFLALVDRHEEASPAAAHVLRHTRIGFALLAGFVPVAGLLAYLALLPEQTPSIPMAMVADEVVALFALSLTAVGETVVRRASARRPLLPVS